jgi:hypothetical protein
MGTEHGWRSAIWGCLVLAALAGAPRAAARQLVANGGFDTDVASWIDPFPGSDMSFSWSAVDADGAIGSGSMQIDTSITNGTASGPFECAPTIPGLHHASARILIPAQANPPVPLLALRFFSLEGCGGTQLASGEDFPGTTPTAWLDAAIDLAAPAGTQSAELALLSGNTTDPAIAVAHFDQVSLVPEVGRAAGIVAAAALLGLRAGRRRH